MKIKALHILHWGLVRLVALGSLGLRALEHHIRQAENRPRLDDIAMGIETYRSSAAREMVKGRVLRMPRP
jgi:hypothetical protein